MSRSANDPKGQAAWLSAIGEPTRLAVLRALVTGEKNVTELAKECGLEMVNLSHHLGVMRNAGLLAAEREGRTMRYSLVGAAATGAVLELTHESGIKVTIPLA